MGAEDSALLRQGMLAEIETIGTSAAATAWANTMLRAKNTLTADDARSVEAAFETKCAGFATEPALVEAGPVAEAAEPHAGIDEAMASPVAPTGTVRDRTPPITKTVRHRNNEHLRFVRTQPCLICGKQPSDPHHLPFAQPRALGRKVSDEYTVPLCRAHHREAHRATKELAWWKSVGVAPLAVAERLWQTSQSGHALNETIRPPRARRAQDDVALAKPLSAG